MNDKDYNPIPDPKNVLDVSFTPDKPKRDVPTLLEMVEELKGRLLIKQVDLETCSDEDFNAAFHFINWHYSKMIGVNLGARPPKPDFIDVLERGEQ